MSAALDSLPPGPGPDPCELVVEGLASQGFAVVPGFLSTTLWRALRREAWLRDRRREFVAAAIGREDNQHRNDLIRRDRTCWLEQSSLAQTQLREQLERLRLAINRELFLGLFDYEAHFAIYEAGAFYRRHLDAFGHSNPRVVSTVLYLNPGWPADGGGHLRLWAQPRARQPVAEVVPEAGTLVCFLSEAIPHEVLAAQRQRLSIAGWFRRNASREQCIDPAC